MSIRLITAHRSTFIRDVLRLSGVARKIFVVGEARSATELVELCRSEQPDVVYAEDRFDDGSEIEWVLVLLMATGARVIVVCDDPSPERLTRILALGAPATSATTPPPSRCSTPSSRWPAERRCSARRRPPPCSTSGAASGSPAAMAAVGRQPGASLTAREHDVLEAMADGLPAKPIARRLGMAVKTVENHKIRIFDKLGVRTQAHAVSLAISQGML